MSDKQLDSPSRKPDPATWVDQHGDFLFRYAHSRLGNRTAAEDMVQETFLAALRAEKNFSGRSAERTWFVGILKHKMIDHLRRQKRERPASAVNSSGEMNEELFDKSGWWQVKPAKWPADPSKRWKRRSFGKPFSTVWRTFRNGCVQSFPSEKWMSYPPTRFVKR